MKQELINRISDICQQMGAEAKVELTRPEEKFGDFACNVAMQLAGKLGKNPREIAESIKQELESVETISDVNIAGPGFINIKLTDEGLIKLADSKIEQPLKGKTVVAEYSDPNPFKVLHAGHLYTSIVGDSIALLLESAGANVHRVNFGGDVGLHVGKTLYVILQRLGGENPEKLTDVTEAERSEWMASAYVEGSNLYEDDEQIKKEMIALNKRVYKLHSEEDKTSDFAKVYWTCRQWSYDYFDKFYEYIGSGFEKYYPESQTAELGLQTVKKHLGEVFEESNGAIVFDGEKHGLHTRVFINSEGLPTYETKDVGLIMLKKSDYKFDKSVVITGNEQEQYMGVVLKAIEQFEPALAKATAHLTHGMVKLAGSVKMSSRKGNILRAYDVIESANSANTKNAGKEDIEVSIAAVKYSFLKSRLGGDIIYNPEESVAIEGNSGPYLQYAHARACSILRKSSNSAGEITDLQKPERSLLRKVSEYPEVVGKATADLMPHHICTYLYELAQTFNSFYEASRVIGDERESVRLTLVDRYAKTLKAGLSLLNIDAPEEM